MPRIHNNLADCVVYLYPTESDAADHEQLGGTGFLVHLKVSDDGSDDSVLFAVTNKHVIQKAPVVRVNARADDVPIAVAPYELKHWIEHPDGDDLAIVPIVLDHSRHKFTSIPRRMLLSKKVVQEFDYGIGDDAFIVGRFINHEGKIRNTPSLRFGNIAQMPDTILQSWNGFEQESFLIEAKSISGYSGSPVFVHMLPLSARPKQDNQTIPLIVPFPGNGPWLLGIDWGHIRNWENVTDISGKPISPPQYVPSNTGMMGVVPAWKLDEMFETERVKEIMKKARDIQEKVKRNSAGVADVAGEKRPKKPSGTPADANPNHREDFDRLLEKAVTPKK